MAKVKAPVVMILFNRPDLTATLFREIARARPSKLLVVADGARTNHPGEAERVAAARKIIEGVDWDCEVLRCFSDTNLGCKNRVSSGLKWAFEQVEEAIILEDDCIPDPSFFVYADELLAKYRNDSKVKMVAVTCFLGERAPTDASYYFSDLPLIWGWATWRRAWESYDFEMKGWPEYRRSASYSKKFSSAIARNHYRRQIDRTYAGSIDTWDYQWFYTIWRSNGVCIHPTRNLVKNLGFGPGATHTHFYDPAFDPPVNPMGFPLTPLASRETRPDLDRIWLDRHYRFRSKVMRRIRGFFGRFAESFR